MDECRLRHSASHDEIRDFEVDAPKKKRTPKQEGNAESVPGAAQGTFKNIASILGETDSQKTPTALRPPNSLPFFLPPLDIRVHSVIHSVRIASFCRVCTKRGEDDGKKLCKKQSPSLILKPPKDSKQSPPMYSDLL